VCTILHDELLGAATAKHLKDLDIPNRYLVIQMQWDVHTVFIHNVYAPANPSASPKFFESLPTAFPDNAIHIVGGDLNAILDPSVDCINFQNVQVAATQACTAWLTALRVVDPWRLHHEHDRIYSSPQRKNRLDYILLSPLISDQYYRSSIYSDAVFGSDHLAVQVKLSSSTVIQRRGPWRLRTATLHHKSTKEWLDTEITSLLSGLEKHRNPGLAFQSWKRRIRRELIQRQNQTWVLSKKAIVDAEAHLKRCQIMRDHISLDDFQSAIQSLETAKKAHEQHLRVEAFHRHFKETETSSAFFFRPTTTVLSRCPIDHVQLVDGTSSTAPTQVQAEHQRF
jgi:hypothetical protein